MHINSATINSDPRPSATPHPSSTPRRDPARTRLLSDEAGTVNFAVVCHAAKANPAHYTDFLDDLDRLDITTLIHLDSAPYPALDNHRIRVVTLDDTGGEIDLVDARTGGVTKLYLVHDPELHNANERQRRAHALARGHEHDPVQPIVLVAGTRVGGNADTQIIEHAGSAWIVQVGCFDPPSFVSEAPVEDRSYGGTVLRVRLNHPENPVRATFVDYSKTLNPKGEVVYA